MESSASTNTLDDMPPEIPQRTDDRLVLVDYNPSTTASVVAPTYDVPGAMTSSTSLSLSHERLPPKVVVNDSTEYEEPSPRKSAAGFFKKFSPTLMHEFVWCALIRNSQKCVRAYVIM